MPCPQIPLCHSTWMSIVCDFKNKWLYVLVIFKYNFVLSKLLMLYFKILGGEQRLNSYINKTMSEIPVWCIFNLQDGFDSLVLALPRSP